ncbi:MAG: hypothetical protein ACK4N5_06215, partial [Myxococcales bacterium]
MRSARAIALCALLAAMPARAEEDAAALEEKVKVEEGELEKLRARTTSVIDELARAEADARRLEELAQTADAELKVHA